jgi:molecular chaperone HtpG
VSKLLRHFKTMLENKKETYLKFWDKFGSTFKEGITSDFANKDALTDLTLFKSSEREELITLKEYVAKMPESQKDIYYMTGESIDMMKTSPYLEKLKEKGYEVLLMSDPVDEWVLNSLTEYDKKKLVSITKSDLDLSTEEEKKQKEEELKTQSEKLKPLCESMQKALDEHVKEVKVSDRLVKSPVCLVSGEHDPSAHMERMMEKLGQQMEKSKRILEINPSHPIFAKMDAFSEEKKANWSEILYNQALLNEGSQVKDPVKFSEQLSQLMVNA